ncbi:MAG: MBL fold metallo-hydrolase [Candidatus Thorarchaeota archaeon]
MIINSEGKINDNYYLIDGLTMGMHKFLSIYIIEHNKMRIMIDVGEIIKSRKIIRMIKDLGLYPIDKIILTHSHWDHAQGISKMINSMKDSEIEILASENAVENLKYPERMAKGFEGFADNVYPFEGEITPLKEGDIIDVNGLELEIINFFGHSMDSIGILDKLNKNIFLGDSVLMRLDQDAFFVPLMPPDFHEKELIKTFDKLRNMKDEFDSISLTHFGVWTDNHCHQILDEMEDLYFKVKKSLIEWYNQDPSIESLTTRYFKTYTPNSKVWNEKLFEGLITMMITGLKYSGFIEEAKISH